jgi:hypothetical protein
MKVTNNSGELLVANRQVNIPDQIVFDPTSQTFVKAQVSLVGGVATWTYVQADPPQVFVMPDGTRVAPVLTTVGGVTTWQFVAA